jgi:hypothetical protein
MDPFPPPMEIGSTADPTGHPSTFYAAQGASNAHGTGCGRQVYSAVVAAGRRFVCIVLPIAFIHVVCWVSWLQPCATPSR